MGRVQINTQAVGSSGEGPTVTGAPRSESVTVTLARPNAASVKVRPSRRLSPGDVVGVFGYADCPCGIVEIINQSGSIALDVIGVIRVNGSCKTHLPMSVSGNTEELTISLNIGTNCAAVTVTFAFKS